MLVDNNLYIRVGIEDTTIAFTVTRLCLWFTGNNLLPALVIKSAALRSDILEFERKIKNGVALPLALAGSVYNAYKYIVLNTTK